MTYLSKEAVLLFCFLVLCLPPFRRTGSYHDQLSRGLEGFMYDYKYKVKYGICDCRDDS